MCTETILHRLNTKLEMNDYSPMSSLYELCDGVKLIQLMVSPHSNRLKIDIAQLASLGNHGSVTYCGNICLYLIRTFQGMSPSDGTTGIRACESRRQRTLTKLWTLSTLVVSS